jgi:hypothetical protein
MELSNGVMLDMYIQHLQCNWETKKSYYYYMNGTATPTLPSARNAAAWEADVVAVNRLLPPATNQRPELVEVVLLSTNDTNKNDNDHHHHPRLRTRMPQEQRRQDDTVDFEGGSSIVPYHHRVMTLLHRPTMMPFWHHHLRTDTLKQP